MTILRYPGGKTRAIKYLEPYIPQTTMTLLSPFFGGGSLEFHLAENRENLRILANDAYEPLINFYQQLKTNRDAVIEEIYHLHPFSKEMFKAAQEAVTDKNNSPIDRAAFYFALNRSSFSGATCSGGYSEQAATGRFTESAIQRCKEINLDSVTFTNLNFEEFLERNPAKTGTFAYLDPPYFLENSKLYGTKGDMHEGFNHTLLAEVLQKRRDWVLSYNNCNKIHELYNGFAEIVPATWTYGMNKSKASSEIFIVPRN
jgi:DNA adenine methylase